VRGNSVSLSSALYMGEKHEGKKGCPWPIVLPAVVDPARFIFYRRVPSTVRCPNCIRVTLNRDWLHDRRDSIDYFRIASYIGVLVLIPRPRLLQEDYSRFLAVLCGSVSADHPNSRFIAYTSCAAIARNSCQAVHSNRRTERCTIALAGEKSSCAGYKALGKWRHKLIYS